MSEYLTIRHQGNLWTCADEEQNFQAVGFVDLVIALRKHLGIYKFSVTFDCEGSPIDGAVATFDFGPPDSVTDV